MRRMMRKRCNECLMTPNNIVPDERRAEILAECERKKCLFNCHKATIAGEQDIACRGHGEHVFGKGTLETLIAGGLVTLVGSNEILAEWEQRRKARRQRWPNARK